MTTTVMGWGVTVAGGEPSLVLMEVDVHVIGQSTCQADYQTVNDTVTDRMFCSGEIAGGKEYVRFSF